MTDSSPGGSPAPPPPPVPRGTDDRVKMLAQTLVGMALVVPVVALLHHFLKDPIERHGQGFVAHFGVLGMAVGTFLSDGFHIPPPPQFYMLTSISAGGPQAPALLAIMAASVCAAPVSYNLARLLRRVEFFDRRFRAAAPRIEALILRYGYAAIIFGSISPIPYPLLCNLCGIYRVPWRYTGVMVALRPLRLLLIYWLIRAGWS